MKTKKLELKGEIKNLRKIIALKCLDCVSNQIREINTCEIRGCSLWVERPKNFKGLLLRKNKIKIKNVKNNG